MVNLPAFNLVEYLLLLLWYSGKEILALPFVCHFLSFLLVGGGILFFLIVHCMLIFPCCLLFLVLVSAKLSTKLQ